MNDKDFFHEKYIIADYLFSSKLTKNQIAKEMDITLKELNEKLRCYNLDWITNNRRKMSRGQAAIVQIIQKILPNEKIEYELYLGEKLYLDIYIPTYKVGIEYHGRQHYEWVPFFHPTEADFLLAQRRDMRKEEVCAEKGISLIVFRYNDALNEDSIFARVLEAIKNSPASRDTAKEVDSEFELKRKKQLEMARQRRSSIRKEIKSRKELDHESQQRQKEYRKLERERRRKLRRDGYFGIYDVDG